MFLCRKFCHKHKNATNIRALLLLILPLAPFFAQDWKSCKAKGCHKVQTAANFQFKNAATGVLFQLCPIFSFWFPNLILVFLFIFEVLVCSYFPHSCAGQPGVINSVNGQRNTSRYGLGSSTHVNMECVYHPVVYVIVTSFVRCP